MTTRNTDLVANFEAAPQVANLAAELGGVVRIAQGNVALLAGDSTDNDIVMLAPIPTNATILSLRMGADGLGGSCTYNVGAYTSAGVVVDEDCFASAHYGSLLRVNYLRSFFVKRKIDASLTVFLGKAFLAYSFFQDSKNKT